MWVLVVVAGVMIVWMGYFVVLISQIERFASANPDQVTRTVGPGSYSIQIQGSHPEIGGAFATSALVMAVIAGIAIVMLAAAVVRRLHDSGRRGWWGLPTPILLMCGLIVMSQVFAAMGTPPPPEVSDGPPIDFRLFGLMMLCNLSYLASLVLLVVLCCAPSQPEANRFGEPIERGDMR